MKADASEIRGTLVRVSQELAYLEGVIRSEGQRDDPDVHQVLETYLAVRKRLSAELSALAIRTIVEEPVVLDETIKAIEAAMRNSFADRIPGHLLAVRGYRGVHRVLLEYLIRHDGSPVSGSLLRLLTGDQVHTERRLRELRDLGYDIEADKVSGENMYVIDPAPDILAAALLQVRSNIKGDRRLSEEEKTTMLAMTMA